MGVVKFRLTCLSMEHEAHFTTTRGDTIGGLASLPGAWELAEWIDSSKLCRIKVN
jgi:hypothetical protein